jgi:hypothetical protein
MCLLLNAAEGTNVSDDGALNAHEMELKAEFESNGDCLICECMSIISGEAKRDCRECLNEYKNGANQYASSQNYASDNGIDTTVSDPEIAYQFIASMESRARKRKILKICLKYAVVFGLVFLMTVDNCLDVSVLHLCLIGYAIVLCMHLKRNWDLIKNMPEAVCFCVWAVVMLWIILSSYFVF